MKILVAVDDSRHSRRALDFVMRARWPAGSRMMVLTVLQPLPTLAFANADMPAITDETLVTSRLPEAQATVETAEVMLREAGFCAEGRVLVGDPREALVQAARDERADLMVMGSHGRTGIARLLLGSVSSHVVNHAPCSVLVVKEGEPS